MIGSRKSEAGTGSSRSWIAAPFDAKHGVFSYALPTNTTPSSYRKRPLILPSDSGDSRACARGLGAHRRARGSLVDDEGECTAGNFVIRAKGGHHAPTAPNGCAMLVFFLKPTAGLQKALLKKA
jgi:hypothetical protein